MTERNAVLVLETLFHKPDTLTKTESRGPTTAVLQPFLTTYTRAITNPKSLKYEWLFCSYRTPIHVQQKGRVIRNTSGQMSNFPSKKQQPLINILKPPIQPFFDVGKPFSVIWPSERRAIIAKIKQPSRLNQVLKRSNRGRRKRLATFLLPTGCQTVEIPKTKPRPLERASYPFQKALFRCHNVGPWKQVNNQGWFTGSEYTKREIEFLLIQTNSTSTLAFQAKTKPPLWPSGGCITKWEKNPPKGREHEHQQFLFPKGKENKDCIFLPGTGAHKLLPLGLHRGSSNIVQSLDIWGQKRTHHHAQIGLKG